MKITGRLAQLFVFISVGIGHERQYVKSQKLGAWQIFGVCAPPAPPTLERSLRSVENLCVYVCVCVQNSGQKWQLFENFVKSEKMITVIAFG